MATVEQAVAALQNGEVIAYPTEGVFGVGCNPDSPDAVQKLLAVKEREKHKGLILIAASIEQLDDYVDFASLSDDVKSQVTATWPGPVTWVMPAKANVSDWVTGQFETVAVRVTDHPLVQELCLHYGKPITSTSANLSGQPPCRSVAEVESQLAGRVNIVLNGEVGGRTNPTEIRDAQSGKVLRQG